jgi:Histidine kinase-, DNA gyrase B-, and HSP90-like ATPase
MSLTEIISGPKETAIERDYRGTAAFQWAREFWKNSEEAGAERIHFAIHWPSVEAAGIYRRAIIDDGHGMDEDELLAYFRTYGASGKHVGGAHDNYGIGSKTASLPWNRKGVVIMSVKDGDAAMIQIVYDPERRAYGLRVFGDELLSVVDPDFDDEEWGINWAYSIPDWVRETGHGTIVVLLGNEEAQHTMLGNPERGEDEESQSALTKYLNQRIWDMNGTRVQVDEFQSTEEAGRPENAEDNRLWVRTVVGLKAEVAKTTIKSGVLELSDATKVNWYVHDPARVPETRKDTRDHPASSRLIASLYQGEVFDVIRHASTFRAFGLSSVEMSDAVTLLMEPPLSGTGPIRGVYPSSDRSRLLVQHGKNAGQPLPYSDWGYEFAYAIPPEIKALAPRHKPPRSHSEARKRLLDAFGPRWRSKKPKHDGYAEQAKAASALITADGDESVTGTKPPAGEETREHAKKPRRPKGRAHIESNGRKRGIRRGGLEAIPDWRWVREAQVDEEERRWIGVWAPLEGEVGCLVLNQDHPVIVEVVEYFQARYPEDMAGTVETEVLDALGEIATARIAHSAHASDWQVSQVDIEEKLRGPAAITMGLLGLRAETQAVAAMLGGRLKVKKRQEAAAPVDTRAGWRAEHHGASHDPAQRRA